MYAQEPLFSFEDDLQGFFPENAKQMSLAQSTIGATHGKYSMRVQCFPQNNWSGWLINGTHLDLATKLAKSRILLADITLEADSGLEWGDFQIALNDDRLGWRQIQVGNVPRFMGTRTVVWDLNALSISKDTQLQYFQFNLGVSVPARYTFYIDNIRILDSAQAISILDFEQGLEGFSPEDIHIQVSRSQEWASTGTHSIRVKWSQPGRWLMRGGNSEQVARSINQGKILLLDVRVPEKVQPGEWWGILVAFNDVRKWRQEMYSIALPLKPGAYTLGIDYRALLPADYSEKWFHLNFCFFSQSGTGVVYIDNIRVLKDSKTVETSSRETSKATQ